MDVGYTPPPLHSIASFIHKTHMEMANIVVLLSCHVFQTKTNSLIQTSQILMSYLYLQYFTIGMDMEKYLIM